MDIPKEAELTWRFFLPKDQERAGFRTTFEDISNTLIARIEVICPDFMSKIVGVTTAKLVMADLFCPGISDTFMIGYVIQTYLIGFELPQSFHNEDLVSRIVDEFVKYKIFKDGNLVELRAFVSQALSTGATLKQLEENL